MTIEGQEPTLSNGGGDTFNNDIIYISTFVMISRPNSEGNIFRWCFPMFRRNLTCPYFQWIKCILKDLDVPKTFIDGHDCDMIPNITRMLNDLIAQSSAYIKNFNIFVVVFNIRCCYNVVNTLDLANEEDPSSELVQRMACEGGAYSLPAGATTLERFKVQDEEDNCVICLQQFNSGDDAAKLPCTHVCHCDCILEWFVENGTCPMCRFTCTDYTSDDDDY